MEILTGEIYSKKEKDLALLGLFLELTKEVKMLTKKIYEFDCYKKTHTSKILEVDEKNRAIILDETIFFPKAGGQECDLGMINGVRVLDVYENDGLIYHEMEHIRYFKAGNEVYGEIDFERRYDNMCQHTAEHIISGIINKKYAFNSVGFHIGESLVRVDYSGYLDEEMLKEVMNEAGAAIKANYPIKITAGTKEELEGIEYRIKKDLTGEIRIVDCGVDSCACCAPHLRSTLEVASIICISNEKYKRGSRLMLLANERAYKYVNELMLRDARLSALLNSERSQIENVIQKNLNKISNLEQKNFALQEQIINNDYSYFAETVGDIIIYEPLLTAKAIMKMVRDLGDKRDGYVLAFFGENYDLGFNLYCQNKDAKSLAEVLLSKCTYKGGGKGENFQGKIVYDENVQKILDNRRIL